MYLRKREEQITVIGKYLLDSMASVKIKIQSTNANMIQDFLSEIIQHVNLSHEISFTRNLQ